MLLTDANKSGQIFNDAREVRQEQGMNDGNKCGFYCFLGC